MSTTITRPDTPTTSGAASQAAAERRRRRRRTVRLWRMAFAVVWLVSWQLASDTIIDPFFSSSPLAIGARAYEWLVTGYIWVHVAATLQEMLIGLVVGASAGILVGFLLGRARTLSAVLDPFVTAVYSLPKLALAPLFILWFGIGLLSKVVLVALMVFFLVFFNTYAGVRDIDDLHVDALRIMGGSKRDVYTKVIMPSSSVWVFTGLKLAIPQALIGAIVGELISSNRGLGFVMSNAASFFDTTGILAGLVYVAAISISINQSVQALERRLMRWKASGGADRAAGAW